MKNVLVGQSGGPTAVINASLYGVVREALAHGDKIGHVYGMLNGMEGFLQDRYMDMGQELSGEELERISLLYRRMIDNLEAIGSGKPEE